MYENFQLNIDIYVRLFGILFAVAFIAWVLINILYFRFYEKKINIHLIRLTSDTTDHVKAMHLVTPGCLLLVTGILLLLITVAVPVCVHKQLDSPYEYLDGEYAIEVLSEEDFLQQTADFTLCTTQVQEATAFADIYAAAGNMKELYLKLYYQGKKPSDSLHLSADFSYQNSYGHYSYYKAIHEPTLSIDAPGSAPLFLYLSNPDPHAFIEVSATWMAEGRPISYLSRGYLGDTLFLPGTDAPVLDLSNLNGSVISTANSEASEDIGPSNMLPSRENMPFYLLMIGGVIVMLALGCWWATH